MIIMELKHPDPAAEVGKNGSNRNSGLPSLKEVVTMAENTTVAEIANADPWKPSILRPAVCMGGWVDGMMNRSYKTWRTF